MPHIATWWCGQKSAREEVLSRLDISHRRGYGSGVPGFDGHGPVLAADLTQASASGSRPRSPTAASTMSARSCPAVDDAGLGQWQHRAGPFVLRVFAAATPDGWTVMPGGFCRIAERLDSRAVSMGDGARAADVWVVSGKTVSTSSLLPAVDNVRIRRIAGWVPSRAADNLFWLGRYLERAEATLRLVRALGVPLRDHGNLPSAQHHQVERIQRLLVTWGATSLGARAQPAKIAAEALQGEENSARRCRCCARRSAPRLAAGAAVAGCLAGHHRDGGASRTEVDDDDAYQRRELALHELASFSGLAQENMNRRPAGVSRDGTAGRAGDQHRAFRAPVRR